MQPAVEAAWLLHTDNTRSELRSLPEEGQGVIS